MGGSNPGGALSIGLAVIVLMGAAAGEGDAAERTVLGEYFTQPL